MLRELHIRQFVLVDEVRLELTDGMTVFTGETGAGKSILVDALGLLFGARASAAVVRHGADRAEIVGSLEVAQPGISALLAEQGIEEEELMIVRRVINADGRSRAWLNGVAVPLKVLQRLGRLCLDLHGQHAHQRLMQAAWQRSLLDAGLDASLLQHVKACWQAWQQASQAMQAWQQQIRQGREQEQWLRQQLETLDMLELAPGLLQHLEQEVAAGTHLAQLQQGAAQAMYALDEGEPSTRSLLTEAMHAIAPLASLQPSLQQAVDMMQQAEDVLAEVPALLQDVLEMEVDVAQLTAQEQRLNQLQAMLHRHGCDEATLLQLQQQWQQQLDALDTAEWDGERLQQQCEQARQAYRQAASTLHQARCEQAASLLGKLRPALDQLALAGMQLRIDVTSEADDHNWGQHGFDHVSFMLSSNPGEPFRPLQQVASGGELSRLVLALKACGAATGETPLAVFDEVDVGVGGETAWSVGELLHAMAEERQVLVITHLPQVATLADQHICITKQSDGQRTTSSLLPLDRAGRLQELARMLGDGSPQGVKQARALWKRRKRH